MISIVGCDHGHQRKEQSCGGQGLEAFEREQKRQFVETIERVIVEILPALVGEEINQGADSFAADLARKTWLRLRECRHVGTAKAYCLNAKSRRSARCYKKLNSAQR